MSFGMCETVKIVADKSDGYVVINKSDLTDQKLYGVDKKSAPKKKSVSK